MTEPRTEALTDGEEERLRSIVDAQEASGGTITAHSALRLLATLDAARLAASPSLDRDPLRERNRARNLASEDASGGFREIAGCKCEHCAASPSLDRDRLRDAARAVVDGATPSRMLGAIPALRAALSSEETT